MRAISDTNMIYLNNAATSHPKPEAVYHAVEQTLRSNPATAGRGSKDKIAQNLLERTRLNLKTLFNIKDSHNRIIFTLNGTDSLNIAIKGVLRSGDNVIIDDICHNSVSRPVAALERAGVITVSRIAPDKEGRIEPYKVKSAIVKNTKLIVITHGSNVSGVLQTDQDIAEIAKIAHNRQALLLIDAAQTAGKYKINVESLGIDLLAAPGHKSLFGPTGTGILYVREGIQVRPLKQGGTGSFSENPLHPLEYPYRLESGTHNTAGIAGLNAGVEYILQETVEKIHKQEQQLTDQLYQGLQEIAGITVYGPSNPKNRISVVSFTVDGYLPSEVSTILQESFSIVSRAGLHCAPWAAKHLGVFPQGTIRFSPGYFTTKAEIETAIKAVQEIAANGN